MVVCGMPQSADSPFWLSPCSSRMMRTDSPGVTSTRFLAGIGLLISAPPIVMSCDTHHLNGHDISFDRIDDAPLLVQAGRPEALPVTGKRFVAEASDSP